MCQIWRGEKWKRGRKKKRTRFAFNTSKRPSPYQPDKNSTKSFKKMLQKESDFVIQTFWVAGQRGKKKRDETPV